MITDDEPKDLPAGRADRSAQFLDDVKAALKEALIPTLQEPGCEALFETSREGNPHELVFFEVFSSPAAHKFHLEQDHTKRMLLHWKASWPERQP